MNIENQVIQVNIDDIIPNRFQPRIAFDEKALNELAASIKEHGIIQPLVLRKLGKKYEIIAGERRYKAATLAGLQTVPAVISNIDDNKSAEVALVENIQRKDLTPIEEARSYKNLLDKGYLTQEQLAKKMGLSQSAVANKLRLLNLDNKVQQALLDGKISERHARSLLVLNDKAEQQKWLDKIINERLTVRQLDQELKKATNGDEENKDIPLVDLNPNIEDIKNNAEDINGNKQKNIANLLVSEDTMTEYSDNLPNQNQMNVNQEQPSLDLGAQTAVEQAPAQDVQPAIQPNANSNFNPFSAFFNKPAQEQNPNQEVLNTVPPTDNKFFNQLEEEPANLNSMSAFSPESVFNIDPGTPTEEAPVNNEANVEIFDMPTNLESAPAAAPVQEEQTPVAPMQDMANPMDDLNPNNKFFQPATSPVEEIQTPQAPVQDQPLNPMDFVANINQEAQVEQGNATMANAINQVRDLVTKLNNEGLNVKIDEADLDASYQINLTIIK